MRMTLKSLKLTYKSLFTYSLVVITLLLVAVPVFANTRSGLQLLDFSSSDSIGNTAPNPRVLTSGLNIDQLKPGEEDWYTYSRESLGANPAWISLAMRYESEARLEPDQMNFQVLAQEQAGTWFQNPLAPEEVLGTGLRSPLKTTDQNLTESFWTGRVTHSELYYVRVFNNSPFPLDYSLEAQVEQPAVAGAAPAGLNSATSNPETLNARELRWSLTAQAVANMSALDAAAWMRNAQMVGWIVTDATASDAVPNPAEADTDILWTLTAQAIAGQDAETATRWLMQADSLGWLAIPLGTLKNPNPVEAGASSGDGGGGSEPPPAQPIQPEPSYTPVNIYPNNPLTFDFKNVNSGRLAPYGEHWYSLVRDDLDLDRIEDMELTMFFTPRTGYMSDRINFELFPAGQYHIWMRGDADYMEHFGAGMWVSRDEDSDTGERLWSGSLVDGDRYLIKVKNGTADVVDYYLFPGDVENAELGNPILHPGSSSGERLPYTPAPPTRPGPPLPLEAGPAEAKP